MKVGDDWSKDWESCQLCLAINITYNFLQSLFSYTMVNHDIHLADLNVATGGENIRKCNV